MPIRVKKINTSTNATQHGSEERKTNINANIQRGLIREGGDANANVNG